MTPRATQPRLPFAPIETRLAPTTTSATARRLGVARRTVYRYRDGGVPVVSADRLATVLGLHPTTLWGRAWAVAFEEYMQTQPQQPRRRR